MKLSDKLSRSNVSRHKLLIALFLLFILSCAYWTLNVWNNETQTDRRQYTAAKVSMVMGFFNNRDPEIHAAIMSTFDPVLVAIVIGIESKYRSDVISPRGCRGLMQLTPDKLADWRNKQKNIEVGAYYLQNLLTRFGSMELAIAAYNAGPEAVIRYRGVPPYQETRRYVEKAKFYTMMFDQIVCFETGLVHSEQRNQLIPKTL
jgi:hypothetical protein